MKKTTKPQMIRQGDVLLVPIDKLPTSLTKQKPIKGRVIVAYGEVTGHSHSIDADAADWWKDEQGQQYVTITKPVPIQHGRIGTVERPDHNPLPLQPGHYRLPAQREYSPAAIRNVAD